MQQAVGRRIRELRLARGLTQEQVAERASLNGKYFGAIERGEINVTIKTLGTIADALGAPVFELLRLEDGAPPSDKAALLALAQEVIDRADDDKVERLRTFFERVFR